MSDWRPYLVAAAILVIAVAPASHALAAIMATGSVYPSPVSGTVDTTMGIGYYPSGSTGDVTVTAGSTLTTQDVNVGDNVSSTGTLSVNDSSWTANSAVFIGHSYYSIGTVSITNGTWIVNSNVALAMGDGGAGTVNLNNSSWSTGAAVTLGSAANVSGGRNCTGTVNLDNHSTWTAQTSVTAGGSGFSGSDGAGQININSGSTMINKLGLTVTSFGQITLDGGTLSLSGNNNIAGALKATANGGTILFNVPKSSYLTILGSDVDFTGCNLNIVFSGFTPRTTSTYNLFDPLDGSVNLATILQEATITTPTNWHMNYNTGVLSYSVPEPATLSLLGLGLAALMARRKRK